MKTRTEIAYGGVLRWFCAFALAALGTGCKTHLAFGTATKFGLDISQKPDQTIDVTMGYRRSEMASIPVAPSSISNQGSSGTVETHAEGQGGNGAERLELETISDADGTNDAYSVLGYFRVSYGDPWKSGTNDGLHLRQFFATGMAARKAAQNPQMRQVFGEKAQDVKARGNRRTE